MYNIINVSTGQVIETVEQPFFVKKIDGSEFPVMCNSIEDADGVMLSDQSTFLGFEGKNMQEYTPLVTVVEVQETIVKIDFMNGALNKVVAQVNTINEKVNTIYDTQTQGVVLQSELDAAYKEGVNSYAE